MRPRSLLTVFVLASVLGVVGSPASAASTTTYAWGSGTVYALGNGSTSNAFTPTPVTDGGAFTSIAAAAQFACGLTYAGAAYCWGLGVFGSIGNGADVDAAVPTAVSGGLTFTQIAAGGHTACGVTSGNAVYCWGSNANGQTGNGDRSILQINTPSAVVAGAVPPGSTFAQVVVGEAHACALTSTGAAYCWGAGLRGQLGNNATLTESSPVAVTGGRVFSALAAGGNHTCGLVGGAAFCWGDNADGALGDGTFTGASSPTAVVGGLSFTAITLGDRHTCGLVAGGGAYCWGLNDFGQLGNGGTVTTNVPDPVSGGFAFTSLSAGFHYTCGIELGGAGRCWGYGSSGKLGNGSDDEALTPTLVSGSLAFRLLVTGDVSAYGIAEPSSDQAGQRPPDRLQQVEPQGDGTCTGIDDRGLDWGTGLTGGWGQSWAQWARGGAGGPVCTRTLMYAQNWAWRVA